MLQQTLLEEILDQIKILYSFLPLNFYLPHYFFLLNFYKKDIITFGIDPILKKYKKNYKNINYCLPDFFSASKIRDITKEKFKKIDFEFCVAFASKFLVATNGIDRDSIAIGFVQERHPKCPSR